MWLLIIMAVTMDALYWLLRFVQLIHHKKSVGAVLAPLYYSLTVPSAVIIFMAVSSFLLYPQVTSTLFNACMMSSTTAGSRSQCKRVKNRPVNLYTITELLILLLPLIVGVAAAVFVILETVLDGNQIDYSGDRWIINILVSGITLCVRAVLRASLFSWGYFSLYLQIIWMDRVRSVLQQELLKSR